MMRSEKTDPDVMGEGKDDGFSARRWGCLEFLHSHWGVLFLVKTCH